MVPATIRVELDGAILRSLSLEDLIERLNRELSAALELCNGAAVSEIKLELKN